MENMSELAVLAWNIAGAEALSADFEYIEKEHLLISMTEIGKLLDITADKMRFTREQTDRAASENSVIEKVFLQLGLDQKKLRRDIRDLIGEGKDSAARGDIHRSKSCRAVFKRAQELVASNEQINGIHLMRALMEDPGPVIGTALSTQNVKPAQFLTIIDTIRLGLTGDRPDSVLAVPRVYVPPEGAELLEKYGTDLVEQASRSLLHECVGRSDELFHVMDVIDHGLHQPLLIGDEGVGKSIIVDTVAIKIWTRQHSGALAGRTIIALDAEAICRQPFPEESQRIMSALLAEAARSSRVILYINDIHKFFDPERTNGVYAGVPLRKVLAERTVTVIGGTSGRCYEEYILKDQKLAAAFENVAVLEPTPQQTASILREWKSKFEISHGVRINDSALSAVVRLCGKFDIPGRLPKKAVKILERACERASVPITSLPDETVKQMATAARKYALDMHPDVHELWIAWVVADMLHAPLELAASYLSQISPVSRPDVAAKLSSVVVGQADAVKTLSEKLIASKVAEHQNNRPLVFMFAGPIGSGKTLLAGAVSGAVFGDRDCFTSFDMTQYGRENGMRNLLGMRDGKGVLRKTLCEKPFNVVLFEGCQNCEPSFYEHFAAFLHGGHLQSAGGFVYDLDNTIFLFETDWPPEKKCDAKTVLEKLPAAFASQVTAVLPFKPISEQAATRLLLAWIDAARTRLLNSYGIELSVSREAQRFLVEKGLKDEGGIRGMKLLFDDLFTGALRNVEQQGLLTGHAQWLAALKEGAIVFHPKA